MQPIQKQAKWLFILLIFTIAYQAFVYGWVLQGATRHMDWPPETMGVSIFDGWFNEGHPPLYYFLNSILTKISTIGKSAPIIRFRLMAFLAFLLHSYLSALGMLIPSMNAENGVPLVWGYVLSVWNPFLLVAVANLQWEILLVYAIITTSLITALKRKWLWTTCLAVLGITIDLRMIMLLPILLVMVTRYMDHEERKNVLKLIFSVAILFTGTVVLSFLHRGYSFEALPDFFWKGFKSFWWGTKNSYTFGWNALTFLELVHAPARLVGSLSLFAFLAGTLSIAHAAHREAFSFRFFFAVSVGTFALTWWRSNFSEMGFALYHVFLYVASRSDFFRGYRLFTKRIVEL